MTREGWWILLCGVVAVLAWFALSAIAELGRIMARSLVN